MITSPSSSMLKDNTKNLEVKSINKKKRKVEDLSSPSLNDSDPNNNQPHDNSDASPKKTKKVKFESPSKGSKLPLKGEKSNENSTEQSADSAPSSSTEDSKPKLSNKQLKKI